MLVFSALNSCRWPWLVTLALVVFVIVSAQVRAFESCEADLAGQGDDVSFSALDDGFIALAGSAPAHFCRPSVTALLFTVLPPSGRLVVPDLFRPPSPPSV